MLELEKTRMATGIRGFTLIELLTVLAIVAIVLGIGVPNMRSLLQSQRVSVAANDLLASINLARSEAIKRGRRVDLVPADGESWNSGWMVFIDEDGDLEPDSDEQVIFSEGPVGDGLNIDSNMPPYLAYQGNGRTRTDASAYTPLFGKFVLTAGAQQREIRINMLGRARVCNPDSTQLSC